MTEYTHKDAWDTLQDTLERTESVKRNLKLMNDMAKALHAEYVEKAILSILPSGYSHYILYMQMGDGEPEKHPDSPHDENEAFEILREKIYWHHSSAKTPFWNLIITPDDKILTYDINSVLRLPFRFWVEGE